MPRVARALTPGQWIERVCWLVALVCALYSGFAYRQAHAATALANALAAPSRPGAAGPALSGPALSGSVIGTLRIRSLGLSVPVLEDDGTLSLLRGLGHIRGTALPGGLGTVGLAGHRDTFLRPLQRVAPSMAIELTRGASLYRYVVDSTEIVHPDAVRVLDTANTPELVLVTCYPFHYIGAAPLRFIVHAHLVSLTPQHLPQ